MKDGVGCAVFFSAFVEECGASIMSVVEEKTGISGVTDREVKGILLILSGWQNCSGRNGRMRKRRY